MRKLLAALFSLFFPVICGAQGQWTTPLPVDLVIPMNTSTPGTTLTNAIANAGMVSNNCVPGGGGSTGCSFAITNTGLKVGANQNACSNLGPVAVNAGGPTYAAQTLNYNNLAMLDSVAYTLPITYLNFGSGIRPTNVTMTVCMTLGMPGQANGNDYDTFWLEDGNGHGSIAQIGNGCGGSAGKLGISIEANSPFAHSSCIRLFPSQTYWISLNVNGTTACAGGAGSCSTLTVYTPNGTQIGQVNVASSFSGLTDIRIPSNENGTDSGTTHYQNAMVVWTGTVPLSLFWTQTDPSAGVLAPTRTGAWSSAGVTGGIPTGRTQCVNTACAAISGSSTAANIQSAFTGAPANTYVLLPAVTYPFCLSLAGASKVTLRGAGANKTIFTPTSSCGGAGISVTNTGGTNEGSPATVSGMTIPGTNVLTLSSVSGLAVGDPIVIDQHDSTTDLGGLLILGTTSAYTGPSSPPGNAGPYSIDGETQNARCPGGQNVPATCFHQEQISVVTNISGSNVTISPALEMPNWLPGNTMSAWWASSPIQYDGIEDLTVNTTGASGSDGIDLTWCANCWTKGVAVINTNLAHVQANYGANDQVENSYFFLTQNHVTSSYGVVCNSASSMLIENNIFHGIASPIIWNGTCNNAVAGYNFNANDYYTASAGFSQNFYGEHSGGVDMSLLEGNITQNWAAADNIHGTGNLSTFFRNVITGTPAECWSSGAAYVSATYIACNNPLVPFQIQSYHRFYSVIGNVLGTTGQNTSYLGNGSFSNADVYSVGLGDSVPNDANVYATMMLWANADSATGYGSPRFNCSEVGGGTAFITFPTSQASLINPCPASHTIPASFYYASKPAWWPSGKAWPIIGPDITGGNLLKCTGGTQTRALVTNASQCPSGSTATAFSGLAYSNPAMDCYLSLGGNASGTGGQLTGFNETACYNSVAAPIVSFSPTSLAFGNQNTGTTSAARTVTLTNTGNASLVISGITLTGSNPTDFAQTNNCASTVLANASCTINVTFTPASAASFSASVSVADNAAGSPQTVALTGTGVTATAGISFSPTSLAFGNQQVSVTSGPLSTTVTNTGSATLTISSITITGTNPSDFAQTNTCSSVAPSLTCSISVTFRPGATGARSASVSVTDNAAGSPQSVPLTGTGTSAAVGLSPASLTFAAQTVGTTSAAQPVTLTNTGNATLTISSITITGTNAGDFSQTNNCGSSVAIGGSCTINVKFSPSAGGSRTASVSIADSAVGSPQTVPLTGTGVSTAPAVTFSQPGGLGFGNVVLNNPVLVVQHIKNTGSATLTISSYTVGGTNASMFTTHTTCGGTLAVGFSCEISVVFVPTSTGAKSATVSVADNAANSPQVFNVTGTGIAGTAPTLDQYGGVIATPCASLTGRFHVEQVGSQWTYCTPLGNEFYLLGVYLVSYGGSASYQSKITTKYGSTVAWAVPTLQRIQGWGFNSPYYKSIAGVTPFATDPSYPADANGLRSIPVKLPVVIQLAPGLYGMRNPVFNATAQFPTGQMLPIGGTVKNMAAGWSPIYYNPGNFVPPTGEADYYDPNLTTFSNNFLLSQEVNPTTSPYSDYILGVAYDDGDQVFGFGAGPDFTTTPPGHNNPNLGWLTATMAPTQVASSLYPAVYTNTEVYTKAAWQTYLVGKYGTIGALNTAWGSTYTTFGSSGTNFTGEAVGTGNGTTTTFTHTLAHLTPTPFTVQVVVGGSVFGGDLGHGTTGTLYGSSVSVTPTQTMSGTIVYSTGALSVTFVAPPPNGAAITVNYQQNGWEVGTGLMDEDGRVSHQGWLSGDPFTLSGANANTATDLNTFFFQMSSQYLGVGHTALTAALPGYLFLGPDSLGSWQAPPARQVLQAVPGNVDVYVGPMQQAGSPNYQAKLDFIETYAGNIPQENGSYLHANPDSPYSSNPIPADYATQLLKGEAYGNLFASTKTATYTANSVHPFIALNHFDFLDISSEQTNWGLVTLLDNAYDGNEATTGTVTCSPPLQAYTCGGEAATYGNYISCVAQANFTDTVCSGGGTPTVSLSASSLSFGNQIIGTASLPQVVMVTNTGTGALNISSVAITGANTGDFGQSNTCSLPVGPSASCTISVVFTPTAPGSRSASVTITDNASGSPHSVTLSGTGIAGPVVAPDPGMFSMLR